MTGGAAPAVPDVSGRGPTVTCLREVLARAGYRDADVTARIGALPPTGITARTVTVLRHRVEGDSPLAVLIRLFLLGIPCEPDAVASALAPLTLDDAAALGLLVASGTRVTSTVQLWPVGDLVLASDWSIGPARRPDHVLRVTAPARTLATMTVRRPVDAVLDVGTGTGFHALLAAGHGERVTATDLNPRAVRVARFNAVLNGIEVELLEGDVFAPVAGRRFGLIVSLPPFVVAPEGDLTFLSAGSADDGVCRRLASEAPQHLDDGGFCQFVGQWAVPTGVPWEEHVGSWFDDGVAAWVLRFESQDPDDYAARILEPMCGSDEEFARRFEQWVAALSRRGIGSVGTGLVTIRRSPTSWRRFDDVPRDLQPPCGDDIAEGFAATDVARFGSDDELLGTVLHAAAGPVVLQRFVFAGSALQPEEAELHRPGRLAFPGTVSQVGAALLARADGRAPLRDLLADIAAAERASEAEAAAALLPTVRHLLECGFLRPTPSLRVAG